jgi:hypothetical protein
MAGSRVGSPRSATTRSAPRSARAGGLAASVHPHDHPEPAAVARLHPGEGVLDHRGVRRRHPKPPGRLQEQRRVGLAGQAQPVGLDPPDRASNRPHSPADVRTATMLRLAETAAVRSPAVGARTRPRWGRRARHGGEGSRRRSVLGVAEPADRLAVRRVGRVAPGQPDGPGGEEAGDAVVAGPAVDMAQVVRLGEGPERLVAACRPLGQVLVEQPPPGGPGRKGRLASTDVVYEGPEVPQR